MQQSLKLGGTNYHFKWVKVPGTALYWKACVGTTAYPIFSCVIKSDIKLPV